MRIGIDARMFGLEHAGIGRYVQNLVANLLKIDDKNEYFFFARKVQIEQINSEFKAQSSKFKVIVAEARHYSLKEQFLMPYLIWKERIDLMHFPHFNVPVLFFGKYVVTIHDLIKHTSRGMTSTTRTPLFYWFKYLGYLIAFWLAVKRAKKILVPSKTVALQLRKAYGIPEDKVVVTYEGVDRKLQITNYKLSKYGNSFGMQITNVLKKYKIEKPFLLYVGSVYPHKNIPNLVKAVKILNQSPATSHQSPVTLVIVCSRSVFWERLKNEVKRINATDFVNLAGFVPDEELAVLYSQAEAFVFPSESEGFGLPGLEAMACGLPVLASDIPVFKEIYQNAALFFDPKDPKDIALKIKEFLENKMLQERLKKQSAEVVKAYSWSKMSMETLRVYSGLL